MKAPKPVGYTYNVLRQETVWAGFENYPVEVDGRKGFDYFRLDLKIVGQVGALTAEAALAKAKRFGHLIPIIELVKPAKEPAK